MFIKRTGLIALLPFFLISCDVSKIHRRDGCPYCRSAFQTNMQKTDLRLEDGSQIAQFDNIGCALRFKAQHPQYAKSEIFVQVNKEEPPLNAKDLSYNDIKIDRFPHRFYAAVDGDLSYEELERQISIDIGYVLESNLERSN
jgi:hypothetical protein